MLDGTEFFECACGGDEHTIRFMLDDDGRVYSTVFLNNYRSFWKRIWVATRYVFGYKCKYGHWDCWIMRYEDISRLRQMLDKMEKEDPCKQDN